MCSGVWDGQAFVYSTLAHIKYLLATGDTGIICTIQNPLYLFAIVKGSAVCMDRAHKPQRVPIDTTEVHYLSF